MSTQNGPVNLNPHNDIPLDALELIRNRMNLVYHSLRKLREQINYAARTPKGKLPSYLNLHGQFQVLLTQLHSIASQLDANDSVLRLTNAYPLPNFPTTQQEALVTTLLRKKPLPDVDEWTAEAEAAGRSLDISPEKDNVFAEWCYSKVKELEEAFNFDGFEERAGDAEKEDPLAVLDTKPALTPNAVMKFMTVGLLE